VQLFAATVFPEWFFDVFLQGVQVRALWGAIRRTGTNW
jgi:hypothetical protein